MVNNRNARRAAWIGALASACVAIAGQPAIAQLTYQEPPAPIGRILDADAFPDGIVSPDSAWLLLTERSSMPSISEVAQPMLGLAGTPVNPRTNGTGYDTYYNLKGLRLRSLKDATDRRITLPPGTRALRPLWSPDSRHVAFAVVGERGITLWAADVATGKARQLAPAQINTATGGYRGVCAWLSTSAALICPTVPGARGAAPAEPRTPSGPIVQEADGTGSAVWTFQNLLRSPHDEALFDHYFSTQIAIIGLDGSVKPIGAPGIHVTASASPDDQFILVRTVHKPYSYITEISSFPTKIAIWDRSGKVVREIADTPLQETTPVGRDVAMIGPRDLAWRADAPATLVWVEALDGGDPEKAAAKRDRLFALSAPFAGTPATLVDLENRYAGVQWVRKDFALVNETWWSMRRARTWAIDPSAPGAAPRKVFDRSSQDRYNNPGTFLTKTTASGHTVVLTTPNGAAAYLAGPGASPEGERPFLDRIDLATLKTERLWRADGPYYESALAVLDDDAARLLTTRESPKDPPNYYVRTRSTGALQALTAFADPAPELATVTPQLLTYTRADGVQLSAQLYLPPGYDKSQGPLPFLFWAYPTEFKDAKVAAQVKGSPYRFTRPGSLGKDHLFALTQGYGVLDDPTMPIIGEGTTQPNDTYVEQLVASAKAAVDKVVELGVADRNRIAVGGHSYGAFMTANLLAHSDLFRTGIARSGAYNRTLTPFGFQNEQRTFWKGRDTYIKMSPFSWADQVKEPILIIHGMADSNPGTFPVQSERFFAAVKGNGGRARYVQLPSEDHGYRARESNGHVLWEMMRWLDLHVKKAETRTEAQAR